MLSESAAAWPRSLTKGIAFTKPPFLIAQEGWGEFEIAIDLYTTEKTKIQPSVVVDLNFAENKYTSEQTIVFKNPSQALQEKLRETGPLPNDDDKGRKKASGKKGAQKFDYEKIAEALQKLEEEDLLKVIQVINENKGPETYIRSDVDGESCYFPGGDEVGGMAVDREANSG